MLALVAILTVAQSQAFAQKTYTCSDIYAIALANKIESRENYNYVWNTQRGDLSYNDAISFVGVMVSGISLPIGLPLFLGPAAISMIKNAPSRAERVDRLQDEARGLHKRFVKKLKNKVSADITSEEVLGEIQYLFDSGKACDKLPKLYSVRKLKKEVTETLKRRYFVNE